MLTSVSVYLGLKVYSVRLTSMSAPVDPVPTVVYVTIRSMAISADVHRVSDRKLYTGLFMFKWAKYGEFVSDLFCYGLGTVCWFETVCFSEADPTNDPTRFSWYSQVDRRN